MRGKLTPFFQEPVFRVIQKVGSGKFRYPTIEVKATNEQIIALSLAKAGYFSGSIENVYNSRVDYVLQTFEYENFMKEFEMSVNELNKKG